MNWNAGAVSLNLCTKISLICTVNSSPYSVSTHCNRIEYGYTYVCGYRLGQDLKHAHLYTYQTNHHQLMGVGILNVTAGSKLICSRLVVSG